MTTDLASARARLTSAIERASKGLVERDVLVEVLFLAAVAGEHVLVIGPPGTAKSQAVRAVADQLGGDYFEYLVGRFTEPNELFGPIDLRRLRDGIVAVETAGMLPEADVAFIDEVFLGSTAILNTLLGILNEGRFRRGSTVVDTQLRLCVGASNSLPSDPALAAFADRFLVRHFVDEVPDPQLDELLHAGWASGDLLPSSTPEPDLNFIDDLRSSVRHVDLSVVRPALGDALRTLRQAGVRLTDRRAVKSQSLVAAAALLDGRHDARLEDLWVLPLIAPTSEAQLVARDVLAPQLQRAANATLPNAAEALAMSRRATATRLTTTAKELLWPAPDITGDVLRQHREAVLREIDATFAPADLDEDLAEVRWQLAETVTS